NKRTMDPRKTRKVGSESHALRLHFTHPAVVKWHTKRQSPPFVSRRSRLANPAAPNQPTSQPANPSLPIAVSRPRRYNSSHGTDQLSRLRPASIGQEHVLRAL